MDEASSQDSRGALIAALAILLYTGLVGASASVVRAAIMAWMGLIGEQIGRRQTGLNSLAFTGAVMCLITPSLPWDVSFQLTFMATLGLVLYATPMQEAFERWAARRLPAAWVQPTAGPVGEYFLMTLAAQITTLPVMVYHFRSLSLISLVANPLLLPPQPFVEILGGLALLGGLIDPILGRWLGYLAWPFVAYTNRMVTWLGSFPNSAVSLGQVSLLMVILFYAALFGFTLLKNQGAGLFHKILSPGAAIAGLAAITILIWGQLLGRPDGYLHLTVVEAGATETLLIQSPTGQTVLINGGPGASQLSQALGRRQPLIGRSLDLVIISSAQKEALLGLPHAGQNFPPREVLWAVKPDASQAVRQISADLSSLPASSAIAQPGQKLDLGQGATVEILDLGDKQGATFMLAWGQFRALLPTGWAPGGSTIGKTASQPPTDSWSQPVNVLLLSSKSQALTNSGSWLRTLHPQLVLLCMPPETNLGPSDTEAVQAFEGYPILRTDQNGWIEVTTDGDKMWVEVEKK